MFRLALIAAAFVATTQVGGVSLAHSQAPALKCDIGPVKRTFGGTPWLVYSCGDGKTVVFVTDEGSPATPFYFILTPKADSIRLSGEGNGEKRLTDAAFEDLKKLRLDDLNKLILETKTKTG